MQAERQVLGWERLALHLVGLGQQLFDALDAGTHGGVGAAGLLDGVGVDAVADGDALGLAQPVQLVGLAAETDDQHGREIRMLGVAGDGAAEERDRLALGAGGAAALVGERDDAVDVREVGERLRPAELVGDQARHGGRAVHRREHADIVARRHAAIGPQDALEGGSLFFRQRHGVAPVGADGVVGGARPEGEVVDVDMLAGLDRRGGIADDLPELADGLAGGDRQDRHLVAAGDRLGGLHLGCDGFAGRDIAHGHDHRIGGIESQGGWPVQDFRHG